MAKVKKETIQAALVCLVDRINSTMPSPVYKFMIGGATGLLSATGMGRINEALSVVTDERGLVDTEALRGIYTQAFKAAGGKLQLELFNKPGSLVNLFVKPITLTITLDDIEQIMRDAEKNSVVEEVSLSPVQHQAAQPSPHPAPAPEQGAVK